jgi:hypothetical protein
MELLNCYCAFLSILDALTLTPTGWRQLSSSTDRIRVNQKAVPKLLSIFHGTWRNARVGNVFIIDKRMNGQKKLVVPIPEDPASPGGRRGFCLVTHALMKFQ